MGTETQDNWNEFFGNKKRLNLNPYVKYLIVIALFTAFIIIIYYKKHLYRNFSYDNDVLQVTEMFEVTNNYYFTNSEFLKELTLKDNQEIESEFLMEWQEFLSDSKVQLNYLDFHESFGEYIRALYDTACETEQLVHSLLNGELEREEINKKINNITEQLNQTFDKLEEVLEANGFFDYLMYRNRYLHY